MSGHNIAEYRHLGTVLAFKKLQAQTIEVTVYKGNAHCYRISSLEEPGLHQEEKGEKLSGDLAEKT